MLAGRPPFDGRTHARGAPRDRQRAAAAAGRRRRGRRPSIASSAGRWRRVPARPARQRGGDGRGAARRAWRSSAPTAARRARAVTRLIVLPFRMLRPDAEIDFLAFSVPDAVTSALSGIESLVVRSSAAALRYVSESPDLAPIAADAQVDAVLLGHDPPGRAAAARRDPARRGAGRDGDLVAHDAGAGRRSLPAPGRSDAAARRVAVAAAHARRNASSSGRTCPRIPPRTSCICAPRRSDTTPANGRRR